MLTGFCVKEKSFIGLFFLYFFLMFCLCLLSSLYIVFYKSGNFCNTSKVVFVTYSSQVDQ